MGGPELQIRFQFHGLTFETGSFGKTGANAHGCRAVAMTDANLHGAVEFFMEAARGHKPIIAAEQVADGKSFIAYVKDAMGYQTLRRFTTIASLGGRATRGTDFAACGLASGG